MTRGSSSSSSSGRSSDEERHAGRSGDRTKTKKVVEVNVILIMLIGVLGLIHIVVVSRCLCYSGVASPCGTVVWSLGSFERATILNM